MNREFKQVKGYLGIYDVSNDGMVYSYHSGKTLKIQTDNNGYSIVRLCKNSICKTHKVHKLVAVAFIKNEKGFKEINHLDEDKSNNKVENLEWTTRLLNIRHSLAKKVNMIKDGKIIKTFPSINSTKEDGFNVANVGMCCNGVRNKHKGYRFEFANN